MTQTPTIVLERRKQVRVRLRPDIIVQARQIAGKTQYVLKDPVNLRYYRFKEREYSLMALMDGRHTLSETQRQFEKRFPPERLSLEEIESFAHLLITTGLACSNSSPTSHILWEQRRQARRRWFHSIAHFLYLQIPVFDPDKMLSGMARRLGWLFSIGPLLASLTVIFWALILVGTHVEEFCDRLPHLGDLLTWNNAIYFWITLGAVKVVHELAHGLSCKAFGGEVHDMGFLLLCFSPSLYCTVSDAWMISSKWRRILISFAGIYIEIVIAALATLVWWQARLGSEVNQFAMCLMIYCGVNSVLINANPLLRFDGYFMLSDCLEMPNLWEFSRRVLKERLFSLILGIESPLRTGMAGRKAIGLTLFAIGGIVYRWSVAIGVACFVYAACQARGLGMVGVLAVIAVVGSLCGSIIVAIKNIQLGRVMSSMKPWRLLVGLGLISGLAAAAVLVPLPFARVKQTALVVFRPDALEKIFVPYPGILTRLVVREGQRVEKNEVLAEFRNHDLESVREEVQSGRDVCQVQIQALEEKLKSPGDEVERSRNEVAWVTLEGEKNLLARQAQLYEHMIQKLVLRAPRAGIVVQPPSVDDLGKMWGDNKETPFCSLAEAGQVKAVMPISPLEYRMLKQEEDSSLKVVLRAAGYGTTTWEGQLSRLPETAAHRAPFELTLPGGGPLVPAGTEAGGLVPVSPYYLAEMVVKTSDVSLVPATHVQVRIQGPGKPLLWWIRKNLTTRILNLLE